MPSSKPRSQLILLTVAIAAAAVFPVTIRAAGLDNPSAPLSIHDNRVFADEFDAVPVAAPVGRDASNTITRWRTSLWFGSGYSRQGGGQGYYADDFIPPPRWFGSTVAYNPFSVKDGVLAITARPMEIPGFRSLHYASGILTTIDSFYIDYGYFEIRLKCPGKPGNWTAFFLYPADDYYQRPPAKYTKWEMDFLEILGSNIDKIHVTTHQKEDPAARNIGDESVVDCGRNDDEFHVFGFDKQPGRVEVYRDGKHLLTKPTTSRMTSPGYLCLVLDVGKDKGWAGTPDPAAYPQSLLVDYVRVYKTAASTVIGGPFAQQTLGESLKPTTPAK